ncbi:hypothetical protein JCM6882_002396 [Rhodosporidiobolus microsporus]
MSSPTDSSLLLSFAAQSAFAVPSSSTGAPAPPPPSVPPAPKRKRARQTGIPLSCTECRRRKIACDKLRPCQQCCKRKEAHLCCGAEEGDGPAVVATASGAASGLGKGLETNGGSEEQAGPSRFYASAVEFKETRHSIALLEQSRNDAADQLTALQSQIRHLETRLRAAEAQPPPLSPPHKTDEDSGASDVTEAAAAFEDAVVRLEEQALGARLSRLSRPVDMDFVPTSITAAAAVAADPGPDETAELNEPPSPAPAGPTDYIAFDPEKYSKRRRALIESVWEDLPETGLVEWILSHYFDQVEWSWHLLHRPTFQRELETFVIMRSQNRLAEVDPLWLARLFALLAVSVGSLDQEIPITPSFSAKWQLAPVYCEAALSCLEAADYLAAPSIWTIEARFSSSLDSNVATASRMCQQMCLHRLGFDPRQMPLKDKALASSVSSLRRETALRVLLSVRILELAMLQFSPCMPLASIRSAEPANVDDAAVDDTTLVTPLPPYELTDMSTELARFRVACLDRHFSDAIRTSTSGLQYETVMRFDRDYRALLEQLPWAFREDASLSYLQSLSNGRHWQRVLLLQGESIYERLIKVHRLHAAQGYNDKSKQYSTLTACSTARKTLRLQVGGQGTPILRDVRHVLRIQNACIILFQDLWILFHPSSLSGPDLSLIRSLLPILHYYTSSTRPSISRGAWQTVLLIQRLDHALQTRKARAGASATFFAPSLPKSASTCRHLQPILSRRYSNSNKLAHMPRPTHRPIQ